MLEQKEKFARLATLEMGKRIAESRGEVELSVSIPKYYAENAETFLAPRHFLLNAKTFGLLPPGAIVINTAHGGLIVDDDLIAALKSGRVAAAGLDVFEGEPKLNPGYAELKNTFLLPHIGSATVEHSR